MQDSTPSACLEKEAKVIAETRTYSFHFSGSGKEYFKIWIVNLFLTILTLGIYSAWAKVRRLQYFDRNTRLAGAVFDFDGKPGPILRGRILAVALLGMYQYAFGFSKGAGIATVLILLLALPLAMRGALRFRLRHTRYRGVRFGFAGTGLGAYLTYLPPLLMFLLPAVLVALDPSGITVGLVGIFYLLWPLMHGIMKRYQHKHLRFGSLAASYGVSPGWFYWPYLKSFGMIIVCGLAAGIMVSAAAFVPRELAGPVMLTVSIAIGYLAFLFAGPYLQVRIANRAWSDTSMPGLTISSHLVARKFMLLQLVNTVLTVITLGLYRPFAVVRTYKFRIDHLAITVTSEFEQSFLASHVNPGSASADGVADFLGVDLSW